MTRHKDLREYIAALEAMGDLKRVHREVSWDMEAAAITRLSYERTSPAPLFENVTGVGPGFRLMGAPAALSSVPGKPLARVALSLGFPADLGPAELVERLVATRDMPQVPPKLVAHDEAACKQNVLVGEDATLDRFPVPQVHEHDGGRYTNTWGIMIARTPDGSWTNWSITRIMMIDGKHMTGLIVSPQHLGLVWQEWAKLGKPMPYALVQGGDPAIPFVGGIPIPHGMDEAGFIGALYGEPIEVVRCESSDLEVPAGAEIVIEGHVLPDRVAVEGPFGEFSGYMASATATQPVCTVECITHRDDPIWPIVAEGRPADEYHTVTGVGLAAEVLYDLRAAGLPITSAWAPMRAATHWMVVTVPENWRDLLPDTDSQEFAHRVGKVLHSGPRAGKFFSHTFVLDDDIDPADDTDLLWALATRIHPTQRTDVWTGPILPLLSCYLDVEKAVWTGPTVVHDGLLPAPGEGRLPHTSFAQSYPAHIRQRVLDHWDD